MTKRTTPGTVAMQFALWGLIGGAGFCATLLARHLPGYLVLLAPLLAFFVSAHPPARETTRAGRVQALNSFGPSRLSGVIDLKSDLQRPVEVSQPGF